MGAQLRVLVTAALLLFAQTALAVDDAARAAGRTVIEQQIEAFRRDDASAAYALASPSIQGMFPSDEQFMQMVRQGYPPVYRPRSLTFGQARDLDESFEQLVQIQDGSGVDWDAVYTLEKQADGTWRISGCRLVKRPGESA